MNTVAQRSAESLTGQVDAIVITCDASELQRAMEGRVLEKASRKGKQMWWTLSGPGKHVGVHFGMTGALVIKGVTATQYKRFQVDANDWPPRFTKMEVTFDDGTAMAFVNSRRIGRVRLLDDPASEPPVSLLGFDPYTEPPTAEAFRALLKPRRGAIKAVLLDQSFSAGVGNWIADEVCYQARVHPARPVSSMDDDGIDRVRESLVGIVKFACSVGADYKRFPDDWLFHVRWGKGKGGSSTRDGNAITFETVGGRTTAVVTAVQGPKDWPIKSPRRKPKAEAEAAAEAGGAADDTDEKRKAAKRKPNAAAAAAEAGGAADDTDEKPKAAKRKPNAAAAAAEAGSAAAGVDKKPKAARRKPKAGPTTAAADGPLPEADVKPPAARRKAKAATPAAGGEKPSVEADVKPKVQRKRVPKAARRASSGPASASSGSAALKAEVALAAAAALVSAPSADADVVALPMAASSSPAAATSPPAGAAATKSVPRGRRRASKRVREDVEVVVSVAARRPRRACRQ